MFALARGGDQKAVHVDDSLCEESGGLAGPHADAGVVEDVLQRLDGLGGKPPAEVACRGGIGESARPQGMEHHLIVAEQFQILQTGAATQRQVAQGEHMVRFMIGEVDLQHLQALVDGLD